MQIGPYEVLGEIARGGMGIVYQARDPRTSRDVAIKVLLDASAASPSLRKRFQREVEALTRLRHPNVVTVHEAGEHNGEPYIVLDLVRGRTLEDRLKRHGVFPPTQAAEISLKLARALSHAHEIGVLHRDLKPGREPFMAERAA